MSQKYEKLKGLLRELFQLDQPDLDFGIYRILHARAEEVTRFLDQDLLPQVKAAFAQYQLADKATLEEELAEAIKQARKLDADPETLPKVKKLRTRLAEAAVDLEALEAEVYDHLYRFFRRYYSEGDFLSRRVYRPGVYAIPYEGEEVKLHWANADQYYIKTSEYLRDYTFRLRPEDWQNPMRVHFRLVDAAEGEHGNVKEQAGKERRFKLAAENFATVEDGELVIRFTYAPDPAKQKELNTAAEKAILSLGDPSLSGWVRLLSARHVRADGTLSEATRLRVHLDRYTARNTFDYFIHKDLGRFLRRELDFYIKNEVMHLDDIENETAPRVEQYLSKIKAIRRIAHKIIDFLAQIENFQKKLWLKKKFVVETQYCVTLDRILAIKDEKTRNWLVDQIIKNDAQREEWVQLFAIDQIQGDLTTPGYLATLTVDFLEANPYLVLDTRHFSEDFKRRLLASFNDLDEQCDGILVHSENFQALNLLLGGYRGKVKCIYIDPPYNTGHDEFTYKDDYQHSSWLTMLTDRLSLAHAILRTDGSIFVSLDDNEQAKLKLVMDAVFGHDNFLANIVWEKVHTRKNSARYFSVSHDYILAYARLKSQWDRILLPREDTSAYSNPDNHPKGPWKPDPVYANNPYDADYVITKPNGVTLRPPPGQYWRFSEETFKAKVAKGEVLWGEGDSYPMIKRYLSEVQQGLVPTTLFTRDFAGDNMVANAELNALFGEGRAISYPKPTILIKRIAQITTRPRTGDVVLDFFAGSGTTAHAVINLNREDGGRRKYILVEMGEYFDTVLVPRIKKVVYSKD